METLFLITYGNGDFFDINKFRPIKNDLYCNKPNGGLWASPINSTYSWKDWCIENEFGDLSSNFKFTITGNIFKITNQNSFNQLPLVSEEISGYSIIIVSALYNNQLIDFETATNSGIDAIWLTEDAIRCREVHGWDCESVLILNPNCIQVSNM